MSFTRTFFRIILGLSCLASTACINPYACRAEYRFAEYKGILGVEDPIDRDVDQREKGRVYVSLDQGRGVDPFQQITISANVWDFVDTVDVAHIHQGAGSPAGGTIFSTSSGSMVRDSVWNGFPQAFPGPGSWQDFWDTLEAGGAYLELHTGDSRPPVRARLTLSRSSGFQPSCT